MGPRFTHLAIQQFEEVVSMKPGVMDWKLGLAISLRRFSQQDLRMSHGVAIDDARETAKRAAELFLEVKNSDAPDLTKAQAAADLGLMLFNENLDLCKSLHNARELSASQCFEEAKRLAPKDVSTLNKIGTYHAINKDFTEARRCFEISIDIMPTAQAHDQLGAVLQNLAEEERKAKAAQQPPADDVHSSGTSAFRTRLTPDDKYVDEALRHFQKAIDLSHGEDTTAVRKRAYLLQKIFKEEEALGDFMQLLCPDRFSSSPFNQMRAYQYAGEIKLRLSEKRSPGKEKLRKEGIQLLWEAAGMWSHLSSLDRKIREKYELHDDCFKKLMGAIQRDTSISEAVKKKERARLLYMMGEYKQAQALCATKNMENSKELNEVEIKRYLEKKDYKGAIFLLSFLHSTHQLDELSKSNCHAPVLAYSLAARDNLRMVGSWIYDFDLNKFLAQKNFLRAFEYMFPRSPKKLEHVGDDTNHEVWHVTILHDPQDDDAASKAKTVKDVLRDACGLDVTRMSDDVHPGRDEWSSTLHQADNCDLLLVVLGDEEMSEEFHQAYLGPCFSAPMQAGVVPPRRLVVQTQQRQQVPGVLTGYPSCLFPPDLLVDQQKNYFSKREIDAISDFFCLMLGVDGMDRYLSS